MDSLLAGRTIQPALPHALPFRVVLEEHRLRREQELIYCAKKLFGQMAVPPSGASTEEQILSVLEAQERAYWNLNVESDKITKGERDTPLDHEFRACHDADDPLKVLLHRMNASALCFSGGGIRSASFSLGILEGLSRYSREDSVSGVMPKLDYLSTVSGGGYIGSWFMSWVYRRNQALGKAAWPRAYREVIAALAGRAPVTGGDPEVKAIRHLRTYTSYLAPEIGLTLDTFTLIAIIVRNLIVNWTMLIPIVVALVAFAQSSGFLMTLVHGELATDRGTTSSVSPTGIIAALIFFLAAACAGRSFPSFRERRGRPVARGAGLGTCFFVLTILGCWLVSAGGTTTPSAYVFFEKSLIALVGYLALGFSIWNAYRNRSAIVPGITRQRWFAAVATVLAAVAMASAVGGLLYVLQKHVYPALEGSRHLPVFLTQDHALFAVLALPLIISVIMVTTSIFCALLGVYEGEDDREWWLRGGGVFLYFNLAWIAIHSIAFYGNASALKSIAALVMSGLGIGFATSYLGYSGATAAAAKPPKTAQLGGVGKFLMKHDMVLPVVGGVSIVIISLAIAAIEDAVRQKLIMPLFPRHFHAGMQPFLSAVLLLAVSSVLAVLINTAININLFSLHGIYRMRLMRAFLGASNTFRHPDPFTQFDRRDTPHQAEMPCTAGVPMHLINATLNLTGTKNPAWRQRKAEGFSFGPTMCGGWRVGYVPTEKYAGAKSSKGADGEGRSGISLATTVAISGAAANPNMGYQSSSVLSLLMTFFNLRLGVWLPNPARPPKEVGFPFDAKKQKEADPQDANEAFFRNAGPGVALLPLFGEALQKTNDTYCWVELSDGGHFENLGLYEMVLRRVKNIIVIDAGADPKFGFEDLGNAIRKIQIDLGVPIKFDPDLEMTEEGKTGHSYCAVAKIDYGCVDEPRAEFWADDPAKDEIERLKPSCGYIVYIKAGMNGDEPADILQYQRTHPTFPHEATGDQFFTESQFESYRHLGSYVIAKIAGTDGPVIPASMESFRQKAHAHWENVGKTRQSAYQVTLTGDLP